MTEPDETPDAMIGRRLGHYLIVEAIGGGAMGNVFRARDVVLRRSVALKVHRNKRSETGLRRFLQESRAAHALEHPGIAEIYEGGQSGPYHYLAMELIDGQTLADVIARGPVGWEVAIAIGREIASALGHAHRSGIVHRDLKPTNVLVARDGRVKLVDFGLAKQLEMPEPGESESTIYEWAEIRTAAGAVLGTPAYMSPEQARAKAIDARADVFALGIVLSELITGRPVFRRATPAATIGAILSQKADRVDRLVEGVPTWLGDVIERCLEKSPDARFNDGADVLFALEAWNPKAIDLSTLASGERAGSMRTPSSVVSLRSVSLPPLGSSARFIGRAAESEQLRSAIARGAGIVAITGPAGVGKTRLVRQYLADHGADDSVLLELAGVRTEEDFVLACALGFRLREGEAVRERLLARLVERRLKLVVLDGLEEGSLASDHVTAWREAAANTVFVVTSRTAPPITVDTAITLGGLPTREGTELFLERAMAGSLDPIAVLDQSQVASRIVERLDGIPLAIELAAARAESVGPGIVLGQIEQDLAWLDPTAGVEAVVDASIRRLDPETRGALLSLSVLRTFDLEGARAVTGLDPGSDEALVARLVALSLVYASPHPELLSEARWAVREPVRRRAEEMLAREGRRHGALANAVRHLTARAERDRELFRSEPARETFRDVLAESPNYLALAEIAVREPQDAGLLGALAGLALCAEALPDGDVEARAAPLLETLVDRLLASPGQSAELRGDALVARGRLRLEREPAMAMSDADRALALAEQDASLPQQVRARCLRASVMLPRTPIQAADEAERAVEIATRSARVPELALALEVLAETSLAASRLERAREAAFHAHTLAEARGDLRASARLSIVSADIAREREGDARARELLLEALDLTNATGQLERVPMVWLALGELEHRSGALAAAREAYERGLSLCATDAVSMTHARLGLALAQLETELGSPERAVAITASVIDTMGAVSAPPAFVGLALATRAATLAGSEQLLAAVDVHSQAMLHARPPPDGNGGLDPLVRAAIGLWGAHLDVAMQASAAGIDRAREQLAREAAPRSPDEVSSPGSRHALAVAIRVLEAVLPRRLSLIP